jgi:hypothetical protein
VRSDPLLDPDYTCDNRGLEARMEKKTERGTQPKHDEELMELESLMGDQYRATCKKCGQKVIIPRHQGENGTAHCTGEWIYVAWAP